MNKEILEVLTKCYVELNKLNAQPGDRCHMLAYSIKFMERMIKQHLKGNP